MKSINAREGDPAAHSMTILTIVWFIAGLTSYFSCFLSITLGLLLGIGIYIYQNRTGSIVPKIHQSPKQLIKILATMYIFGLLDAYCLQTPITLLSIYLILSTIRHYGQFLLINCFHGQPEWESFLIYHSFAYTVSNIFLIFQHIITKYVFGFSYKDYHFFVIPAFIVTLISTFVRIMAFFTAKANFTHRVAYRYRKGHQLVTHGIYKYLRHPSYTAFFYNSVFGMIMIGNFISAFVFAIALSKFFEDRIIDEQQCLIEFFDDRYLRYREKTYVLIPYVPKSVQNWFNKVTKRS